MAGGINKVEGGGNPENQAEEEMKLKVGTKVQWDDEEWEVCRVFVDSEGKDCVDLRREVGSLYKSVCVDREELKI